MLPFSLLRYFLLHFGKIALFPCCTFFNVVIFCVAFFTCCTLFMFYHLLCCTLLGLQFFRVALFSSCTLFMFHLSACCAFFVLYFFHVAPCFVLIYVALTSWCAFLCCTHFVLQFFHVALFHFELFSGCIFLLLYIFFCSIFSMFFPWFRFMLNSFPVVLFSCFTHFLFHFFRVCSF